MPNFRSQTFFFLSSKSNLLFSRKKKFCQIKVGFGIAAETETETETEAPPRYLTTMMLSPRLSDEKGGLTVRPNKVRW